MIFFCCRYINHSLVVFFKSQRALCIPVWHSSERFSVCGRCKITFSCCGILSYVGWLIRSSSVLHCYFKVWKFGLHIWSIRCLWRYLYHLHGPGISAAWLSEEMQSVHWTIHPLFIFGWLYLFLLVSILEVDEWNRKFSLFATQSLVNISQHTVEKKFRVYIIITLYPSSCSEL
jgi:hypothetical protein